MGEAKPNVCAYVHVYAYLCACVCECWGWSQVTTSRSWVGKTGKSWKYAVKFQRKLLDSFLLNQSLLLSPCAPPEDHVSSARSRLVSEGTSVLSAVPALDGVSWNGDCLAQSHCTSSSPQPMFEPSNPTLLVSLLTGRGVGVTHKCRKHSGWTVPTTLFRKK